MVSDSRGRFHVLVKKTKSNLGIAIEGGADTKHLLPRVINIAANGAAFEAGGLRVGQLILAVDGLRLEGKFCWPIYFNFPFPADREANSTCVLKLTKAFMPPNKFKTYKTSWEEVMSNFISLPYADEASA